MDLRRLCAVTGAGAVLLLTGCGQDSQGTATPPPPASPTGSTGPSVPAGDPDLTGRLLFSRFDESTHTFVSTHVSDADGTQERAISMPDEGGGRWSRSGDQIAVTRVLSDGRIGTAILSPDGTVERELDLPTKGLNLACTVWAPDDKRLACEGWDDADASRNGLYTVRASDGGGLVRLTTSPSGQSDLIGDYSPDGTTVLFKRTTDEDPGPLLVVPAPGGETRRLAELTVEDPGRYSPDGRTILTSAGGRLLLLDGTGHEVDHIDRSGLFLFGPVWSPDGQYIAYSATQVGVYAADLFTSRPDGTDLHQVTSTTANEIRVEWGTD